MDFAVWCRLWRVFAGVMYASLNTIKYLWQYLTIDKYIIQSTNGHFVYQFKYTLFYCFIRFILI